MYNGNAGNNICGNNIFNRLNNRLGNRILFDKNTGKVK